MGEFNLQIEEARLTIEEAQVTFNEVAERNIIVQQKRQEELAEIEKNQRFTDAQSHFNYIQNEIKSSNDRLKYFDQDAEAAEDEEKLVSCEPTLLYTLDATNTPQVSQVAVDIINAIGSGIIDPATYTTSTKLPAYITVKP
jgi:outer membrane PBP1 activator LpoA protein